MFCSSHFSRGVFNSWFAVVAASVNQSLSRCAHRCADSPGMLPGRSSVLCSPSTGLCCPAGSSPGVMGCGGVQWGASGPGPFPAEPPAPPSSAAERPLSSVLQGSATKPEMYWK